MLEDRNARYTPAEKPNHHAIGRYFRAWDGQVYFCDSYQWGPDYGMVNVVDRTVRKEVSTAAIGRTFHELGTADRPACVNDICDMEKYAVDTLVAPEDLTAVLLDDKDCVGMPHSTALFYAKYEAERFIRAVQKAKTDRIAELADKAEKAAAASNT